MAAAGDAIRRFVVGDVEETRFEDDHVEPYVSLRRISADPAVREVTFPPNATLGAVLLIVSTNGAFGVRWAHQGP